MDALLMIPEEVTCHILSAWLSLKELSRLDIAYCNKISRGLFRGLIRHLCPFSNGLSGRSGSLLSREQLVWLVKRGVSVINLTICVGDHDTYVVTKSYLERGGGLSLLRIELIQRHDHTNSSLVNFAHICSQYSTNIHDLCCSYLMNMSGEVLRLFADGCPAVERLHLDYCDFAAEDDVDELLKWAYVTACAWHSTLVYLSVSHTSCKDEDVAIIVRACGRLQHIDISKCNVTDTSVLEIAVHCPHLTFISLNDTDVGDESIEVLAQSSVLLREVVLGLNDRVTDACLHAFAMHCPSLHSLDISECENITDEGMNFLAQFCPPLTVLDVSESLGVTEAGAMAVAQSCPLLQVFQVHETMVSAALLELMGERVEVAKSFSQDDWLAAQGGKYWKDDVHEIDVDGERNSVYWGRGRVNSDY